MFSVRTTIRKALRKSNDEINVLILGGPASYLFKLASSLGDCEFYAFTNGGPTPPDKPMNLHFIQSLPIWLEVDCVIVNERTEPYDTALNLTHQLHCSLILIDHKPKEDYAGINNFHLLRSRAPDYLVFSSRILQESWEQPGYIIPADNEHFGQSWLNILKNAAEQTYIRL